MTTLVTPPSASPAAPDFSSDGPVRLVRVCAHLLPEEVIAGRRLSKLKKQLGKGFVGLIALLLVVYAWSWWQTKTSRDDLASAQSHTAGLQSQIQSFGPLVIAQGEQARISQNLKTVMATDLQWRDLLVKLQSEAVGGVQITGVTGAVTGAGAGTAAGTVGLGVLNQTGLVAVGTLNVTGIAPDSRSVAALVDRLAVTKGLASPVPISVSGTKGGVAFEIDLLLTSDVLGGRFASAVPATSTIPGTATNPVQGGH
jgi:Tfp pilus assembly protein PilN